MFGMEKVQKTLNSNKKHDKSGIRKNTGNLHKYVQSRNNTIKHEQIELPMSNTTKNAQITQKKRYSVQNSRTRRNLFWKYTKNRNNTIKHE